MKLHVRGSGSPILLCHGIGAAQSSWGEFADLLAESHTVITFDAPGCGDAPARWVPYTMRSLAADVARKVRQRFGRVHVAGLSWGGVMPRTTRHHARIDTAQVCVAAVWGVGGTDLVWRGRWESPKRSAEHGGVCASVDSGRHLERMRTDCGVDVGGVRGRRPTHTRG